MMMVSSKPSLTSAVLVFCSLLLIPSQVHSSSAPWQPHNTGNGIKDAAEEDFYKNLPLTVFSSNGRLHSVERETEAASNPADASSNVAVAICYQGGVVVVSSSTKSPHLDEDNCTEITIAATVADNTSATTNVTTNATTTTTSNTTYLSLLIPPASSTTSTPYQVGPNVYATTGGNAADSQLLRDQILQISTLLWESRSATGVAALLPPSLLARHVADHLQRPTQQMSSGKILASQALVWDSSSIWRVDPSGQFWKCRAAAIGRSRSKVETLLVKGLLANNNDTNTTSNDVTERTARDDDDADRVLTQDEAIQLAVESVQSVVPKERRLFGLVVTTESKKTMALTHEKLITATTTPRIIKH